jgi:uncharacterized protein with FMN-binding domain
MVTGTRRNAAVLGATALTVAVLFLFPTSTNSGGAQRRPGQAIAPAGIVSSPTPPSPSPAPGGSAAASPAPAAAPVLVVNGTSADTQYGPVQVQLKVQAGRVLSATAIDYPQESGRDQEINSNAIPILQQETVRAQSAHIDSVSGATYTSGGYLQSLQAALDAAHLH